MKKIQQGFTLIELLVVIAIIGILASVVLSSVSGARAKAKTAAFKSEVTSVIPSLIAACDSANIVLADFGSPTTFTPAVPGTMSCGSSGDNTFAFNATATNGAEADSIYATCSETGCAFSVAP